MSAEQSLLQRIDALNRDMEHLRQQHGKWASRKQHCNTERAHWRNKQSRNQQESQSRKNAMDNWEKQWKEADDHMRSIITNRDVKRNQINELQQRLKSLRQQRRQ